MLDLHFIIQDSKKDLKEFHIYYTNETSPPGLPIHGDHVEYGGNVYKVRFVPRNIWSWRTTSQGKRECCIVIYLTEVEDPLAYLRAYNA